MAVKELSLDDYRWVAEIDPEKSMVKGQAYLLIKRVIDLVIVILALPFWLPVLAVIALTIWLQSPGGPVIFVQERTGKDGRRFRMYKFRSMVPDAEALKEKYMHMNELKWPDFKITHDPRITPVGHFLRKTSLDELPQLLNVLKGEMSLVGPRPTSFGTETYRLWHTERLDVLPGITGLWQIVGRGEINFDERLRLDIAYIERRCLSLDIQILIRTIGTVLKHKGT